MRTTFKSIVGLLWIIVLCTSMAFPCLATTESGRITVSLEDQDRNKINGTTVYLCQIAELNDTGYYPTAAFENSGISLSGVVNNPDQSVAKTIADYIKDHQVSTLSAKSENGNVSFPDLDLGIWLVYCDDNSQYTFNPYIVFLPFESDGKLYFEILSTPKMDDSKPDKINIYVIKKWDDQQNAAKKRPNSVVVELLNDKTVVASVELSEANGWAHTFSDFSKDGVYTVREKKVADYIAHYSGDVINGFVVTNTYAGEKLPQTGQYWWPMVIIAVAGVGFVLLGIYEIGVKKHAKKK